MRIYNSENGYLLRNGFDISTSDAAKIIEILTKLDLIETESNPDVYFLTPEAYSLIESNSIESFIYEKLYVAIEEDLNSDNIEFQEDNEEYFEDMSVKHRVSRNLRLVISLFLAVILSLIVYSLRKHNSTEHKKELEQLIKNSKLSSEIADTLRSKK